MDPQLRARLLSILDTLERDGIDAVDDLGRQRLAYFFVLGATKGTFALEPEDRETLRNFVDHCRANVLENPTFDPATDHKTSLRLDARILGGSRRSVGSLILYATWIEHWINGVISVAGARSGLDDETIRDILRSAPLRAKLTWILRLLGMPPLPEERIDALTHLTNLRNEYVHYKWSGTSASWREADQRLKRAVDGAEDHLRYLVGYAVENLFEPAVSTAERILRVEYREWMPFFV